MSDIFQDNTTIVKNHTIKTYIFCVLFRILLGLLVITNKLRKNLIIIISLSAIIIFLYKYFKLPLVWKVYLRTILIYTTVLILTVLSTRSLNNRDNNYNNISGTLIIIDALMGLQSRHIFSRISVLFEKHYNNTQKN